MHRPLIPDRAAAAGLLLLGAFAGAAVALSAGQDASFDVRNYHWYNAWALLHGRMSADVAPAQLQTWFNPALDLVYYGLIQGLGPAAGAATLGAIQGLGAGLVGLLGLRLFPADPGRSALAAACTVSAVAAPVFLHGVGTSQGDLLVAGLILAGLVALLTGRFAWWGVVTGLAAGLKPTVAPFVLAGVPVLALRGGRSALLAGAAGGLAGWAAGGGWWAWTLGSQFGNPVFPMFNGVFRSPWAASEHFLDQGYFPSGADWLFLPLSMARGGEVAWDSAWRDARLLVLVLASAAWLSRRRRESDLDHCLIWAGIAYVAWLRGSGLVRYLAPLELLAPVLIVTVVTRLSPPRLRVAASLLCLAGVALWMRPPDAARVPFEATPFEVVLPPSAQDIDVVVSAGDSPVSYLAPAFPEPVRHVRVVSSVVWHEDETRLLARARRILASADRIALLTGQDGETMPGALHSFGLSADLSRCEPVGSSVDQGVLLCPVHRTASSGSAL